MSVPRGSYVHAYLEHKLVTCIAQQADAFGQGVRDVLPLLGSRDLDELKAAWARHAHSPSLPRPNASWPHRRLAP